MKGTTVDPPLVAALVQPLQALRASLGTGVGVPSPTVTQALSSSSAQAAETEGPHRTGMHALESTWTGSGADAAVPALRTTRTQIGAISDRGPAYLAVLADAHTTSAQAAQRLDLIIAEFRRDAKTIISNASTAPDTDAVITRASQALRDALTAVTAAQSEMEQHTRRLDDMGPLTVSQPVGLANYVPGQTSPTDPDNEGFNGGGLTPDTPQSYAPGGTPYPGTPYPGTPAGWNGAPYYSGQPMDPAQAAQLQLQQQLIAAGVQVGSAAISAGVDIGTHLIDKISEVGEKVVDDVAGSASQLIPQLLHPGTATNNGTAPGTSTGNPAAPGKMFDFGQGQPAGTAPTTPSSPGTVIPPSSGQNGSPAPQNDSPPQAATEPDAGQQAAVPKPAPPPPPPPPPTSNPGPDPSTLAKPDHGSPGGMAVPPPLASGGGQDAKPRDGQLGVTTPAAEEMAPVAVIGDFGDDTL